MRKEPNNFDFDDKANLLPQYMYNMVCYGTHSIRFLGPHISTKLMLNIRESPSLQSFKRNLRNLDLSAILNNNDNCCNR